ncbi:plant-specific TFIIB-related protein PTF2-like [Abrus precatorius]|uniref:Plant-specific TFIIB-related protein PTF2-like n=1 Tax=Abrus precatorius TaxID=3816 RepID=A0A8B8K0R8_ABRPR|nr:plant-specific TFIIB-related protein PTF2-like [Abrus precatorius]
MLSASPCNNCAKTTFIRDDVSGDLVCSSCGVVQQFDQFDSQIGGIDGPRGTFINVGTAGSGSLYTYRDRKLFAGQNSIDELTFRLGLTSKSVGIRNMISIITEGEFGQGNWFQVLIGACAYVVMRRDDLPLPMAEIASAVECDVYELGKMIMRVVDFLDLKSDFPEFDIVHSLQRTLNNSPSFASVERNILERMRKQGIFFMQCAVKWFLSTGRRPIPLVVAVLVFVAELNDVQVRMDDLAKEVHATVSTCRASIWRGSLSKPVEKGKNFDQPGLDLADTVAECLRHDDEFEYGIDGITSRKDSRYFLSERNADKQGIMDVDKLLISPECLSLVEWWDGKSELSKKLVLKQLLEKDVGVETMPPSFLTGQLKCKMRQERINAAKVRIKRILHSLDADTGDAENPDLLESPYLERRRKKRRGMVVDDIDWEDLIIETLILHQVKEEEIEKGHYNTLLDLHLFNSGIV